jgi:hypothetical protein
VFATFFFAHTATNTRPDPQMTDTDSNENLFERLFRPSLFESMAALMSADAAGSLSDDDFARHWGWFLRRILPYAAADCHDFPEPVIVYWATGLMEYNVFNGGFAQAAYNIPDWFVLAAIGYEQLGRPIAAGRIRQAAGLALTEQARVSWLKRRRAEIRAIFAHFRGSALKDLAKDLSEIGWDVTAARIQLDRAHRAVFASLDARMPKPSIDG